MNACTAFVYEVFPMSLRYRGQTAADPSKPRRRRWSHATELHVLGGPERASMAARIWELKTRNVEIPRKEVERPVVPYPVIMQTIVAEISKPNRS